MATTIYLRRNADLDASTNYNAGQSFVELTTSTSAAWLAAAGTSRGGALAAGSVNTVAGPTSGVEIAGSGSAIVHITPPLSADVTVSGTVTLNVWSSESSMNANVAINVRVLRVQADGTITEILKTARTTEVALTTRAVNNFTATPTSTNFKRGDRILLSIFGGDAGTMGSGFTFDASWGATSGAVDGDSFVTFTESLTFESAPAGTSIYPTATTALSATQLLASTSRGSGVATTVTNSVTGLTAGVQVTATAGGSAIEWYTDTLTGVTLDGAVLTNVRGKASSINTHAALRCEIAVTAGDGTGATVWGTNGSIVDLTASEAAYQFWVGGPSTVITTGQRIRVRLYIDDLSFCSSQGIAEAMVTGRTITAYYAGSAGATGDFYLTFPVTLTPSGGGGGGDELMPYVGGGYYP